MIPEGSGFVSGLALQIYGEPGQNKRQRVSRVVARIGKQGETMRPRASYGF
jgi:hypothetical protein